MLADMDITFLDVEFLPLYAFFNISWAPMHEMKPIMFQNGCSDPFQDVE